MGNALADEGEAKQHDEGPHHRADHANAKRAQ
jgi:hypothetical protein